ncbi:MAG: glycosyltransferase [Actinobacteria bacterium]|nr:glycosyltransferase [Actinomycetota bacterium]
MAATPSGPCRVFVSERGNVFMREIADHLVEALVAGGRPAEVVTDRLPEPLAPGADPLCQLVVAPHEFFVLFPASEVDLAGAAAHAVCINTEQQGTPFFDLSMQYARRGRVVLDINTHSLGAIRRLGLPAVHLPLGYVPSMDRWTADRDRPRSIDLAFLGGRTPRREQFIGGAAGQLWEWRTDLRFFSWHRPALAGQATFTSGDDKYERLADTRILLNVHRDTEPYFEWARVVEAVANGCVIATETSVGIEPFRAGEHLVMTALDDLVEQAVALSFDEPRRARMADSAYEVLTTALHQRVLVDRALAAAADAIAAAPTGPSGAALSATTSAALGAVTRHLPARRHSRTLTAPAAPTADRQMLEKTARDLKQAFLDQMRTIRAIERSLAALRHGDPDHVAVTTTPAADSIATTVDVAGAPVVSVVIPLFNQGHYLRDAIHSVVSAAHDPELPIEVVIVDDHSTDSSLRVAQQLLEELPWLPITLVARAANGGLPTARNTGFARARGRYVFALDADNLLYPNGLVALARHLDDAPDDVVAAYGLLERFDETGALGLTSHLPWDPDLLVHGAFIDAMAMFRKDAWLELGGYSAGDGIYGWEDYDLWLATAERGRRASLVTSVVGRYREQPGSMRKISDIDMATNFVTLRERHPRLPWPS